MISPVASIKWLTFLWKYKKCPTSADCCEFYCNLFCFSVAITDLSPNTAIKFKFRNFYAMKVTKNESNEKLFPFPTDYHI